MDKPWKPLVLALVTLVLAVTVVLYPRPVFVATLRALELWATAVVPALFPFLLLMQLMLSLGLIHGLGILLEPLMRPLFNLPGAAATVVATGYSTGAPAAAQLATQLYTQRLCTRSETERLIAFTTNASPLFIFGTVAVALLQHPEAGRTIALAHYGANLALGLAWRAWRRNDISSRAAALPPWLLLQQAARAVVVAYSGGGRPLGQLLADAISHAGRIICLVGGFIVFFAIVIQVMEITGIITGLENMFAAGLTAFGLDSSLAPGLARGCLEMTLGMAEAAASPAPLFDRALVATVILSWAGLSIHAQVAGVIARARLSLWPFIITRAMQAVLAGMLFYFTWEPVTPALTPVLSPRPLPPLLTASLMLAAGLLAASIAAGITTSCLRYYLRRY